MITVYHNSQFLQFWQSYLSGEHPAPTDHDLVKVAVVAADNLDEAFTLTNNISTPWILNKKVTPTPEIVTERGARSTSVGDVLETHHGKRFVIQPFGFEPLAKVTKR